MELHLLAEDRLGEVGEAAHRRQVRRARRAEREHARVVDEEDVVLAHVAREALHGERPVGDPEHERVLVLGGPDRVGLAAQVRRERRGGLHAAAGYATPGRTTPDSYGATAGGSSAPPCCRAGRASWPP